MGLCTPGHFHSEPGAGGHPESLCAPLHLPQASASCLWRRLSGRSRTKKWNVCCRVGWDPWAASGGLLGSWEKGPPWSGPLEFWHLDVWESASLATSGSSTASALSLCLWVSSGLLCSCLSPLFSVLSLFRILLNLWACGEWASLRLQSGHQRGRWTLQPLCCSDVLMSEATTCTTPRPAWRPRQHLTKNPSSFPDPFSPQILTEVLLWARHSPSRDGRLPLLPPW